MSSSSSSSSSADAAPPATRPKTVAVANELSAPPQRHHHHHPDTVSEHTDASGYDPEKTESRPQLERIASHGHDIASTQHAHADDPYWEAGDEVFSRFTGGRKRVIVAVVSFSSFLVPISSGSVLPAIPEVAAAYVSSGTVIGVSNACFLLGMGVSPMFWGPVSQVYGRRASSFWSALGYSAASVGTALSPNLAAYFVFRVLTAFNGTSFLIVGSSVIGDIYKPTERATALSWFLVGCLVGPALGPFIGGVIVTYASWRNIFWLQAALGAAATILVLVALPETIHRKRAEELVGLARKEKALKLWEWMNPWRVLQLLRFPNLVIVGLASSSLVWNMYSLLTPIRYVVNPRFHLTTPLQSGLFYLPPGFGYLLGTFFGGRWADYITKRYIRIRGQRIAEDRLRSSLPAMVIIAACMLVYGWSLEYAKGGIALPVIVMFLQAFAQLFCFPALNTYCLDVIEGRSSEVIAGNYAIRYLFAAAGSASCLPGIQSIGIGWFSTISSAFIVGATALLYMTTLLGRSWRDGVNARIEEKRSSSDQST